MLSVDYGLFADGQIAGLQTIKAATLGYEGM